MTTNEQQIAPDVDVNPSVEQPGAATPSAAPGTLPDNWRVGSIGGSDIAGILGLSPYASPWSVWAETTGLAVEQMTDEKRARLDAGSDAEQYLAAQFRRHHQATNLTLDSHQVPLTGPEPWMTGHADGEIYTGAVLASFPPQPVREGWEAKTDRSWKPWEYVPPYYQCQAQWYMYLSGWKRWHFTVGFSGWKVAHYVLDRNDDDIELIVKAATDFWHNHIVTGIPPAVDEHPATATAVATVYAEVDPETSIEADDTLAALIAEYDAARAHVSIEKKRQDALATAIKAAIGTAETVVDDDGNKLATWSPRTRTNINADAVRADHGDKYDTETSFRALNVTSRKPPQPKDKAA